MYKLSKIIMTCLISTLTWAGQTWAGQTWAGQTWAGQTWAGQNDDFENEYSRIYQVNSQIPLVVGDTVKALPYFYSLGADTLNSVIDDSNITKIQNDEDYFITSPKVCFRYFSQYDAICTGDSILVDGQSHKITGLSINPVQVPSVQKEMKLSKILVKKIGKDGKLLDRTNRSIFLNGVTK